MVGGGGAKIGFRTKVEAGLQPAENRRPVSYGFAIGYYEAAPSALQATCGFRNFLRIFGTTLQGTDCNMLFFNELQNRDFGHF
jgi:hypothetical protein